MKGRIIILLAACLALPGCSLLQLWRFATHDQRSFSISTVSLFNQRISPPAPYESWKGDWLFRRHRLELLDQALFNNRPDLMVFQQLMQRRGSPIESDKSILGYSSLEGYQWNLARVDSYADTQEDQFLGVAASLPIRLEEDLKTRQNTITIGKAGYAALFSFKLEDQAFLVVNVEMPDDDNNADIEKNYAQLEDYVKEALDQFDICEDRLIIAGYLPSSQISQSFETFLTALGLQDSAEGYCELATDCETSSRANDLLNVTDPALSGAHSDRVLVPDSALVYSSQIAFNEVFQDTSEFKKFGIDKLWPTRRFGWSTTLRLKACSLQNLGIK